MVVDCTTGETHILSEGMSVTTSDGQTFHHHELEANSQKVRADAQAREQALQKQRDADAALIKAKAETDPAFAALVRHLGID